MIIKRAKKGESIREIAAEYCISPQYLMQINGVGGRELSEGREIVIPLPSRSVTAHVGDTVESISHRFGVRVGEIYSLNPEIYLSGRLYPSEYVVLGLAEPRCGVAAVNGHIYPGITREKVKRAIPYLNTLTISAARAVGGRIRSDANLMRFAEVMCVGVCPILRIYIEKMERCDWSDFLRGAIMLSKSRGFTGIALGGVSHLGREAAEFTLFMRRGVMECGLSLSVEGDLCSEENYTEYADTAVMSLDKIQCESVPSFTDFEKMIIEKKSESADVSNMLIDLPAFAISCEDYIGRDDLFSRVDARCTPITHDEERKTFSVKYGRGNAQTESIENTVERIRIASECGYLGFSVDLSRVPFVELFCLYAMTSRPMNLPSGDAVLNCRGEK